MSEEVKDIATIELPYRRKAVVREATFGSGMKMVRLVLREGTRITQVDLDEETATRLGTILCAAAGNLGDSA